MEYNYTIYPEEKLVIDSVSGGVTIEAFVQHTEKLFAEPEYSPTYSGLIDLRGATSRLSKVEVYGLANYLNQSEQFGKAPWAVLVKDPVVLALAQVFQKRMVDDTLIGIFSTVELAAEYLEKPELLKRYE
ncbi:MAG: hypothetical protein AAGH40_01780 [Verrucomicrobiota bacterium]